MAAKFTVPRGTYDILPEASYKWEFVTQVFKDVAKEFNYKEIVTPIFENSNIFERSVGETSDIVEKEMYKFEDKKGRSFALRPEGTASVMRSFIENGLNLKPNSSKLYYLGPMFRYDRPQKGRYRQFYQYGIENIGNKNPFSDAEVIAFGYNFLNRLGLKNFQLQINSIGCGSCTKDYDNALIEYFTPNFNSLCSDCRKRLQKNPKRVLDCKVKTCKEIAANAPSMMDYLDEDCRKDFEKVQEYLKLMDIPFLVNPKIVRGLDYYSQTAFEFIDTNLGAQNTLIGGGRYNSLAEQLGSKKLPGVGFAGGFERLLMSMEEENLSFGKLPSPKVYLVLLGDKAVSEGVRLLAQLRNSGISAEFDSDKSSMGSQMKMANKTNAEFALILGENELEENKIVLKNLTTGDQQKVDITKIIERLKDN